MSNPHDRVRRHCSVPIADARAVRVVAHMRAGVVMPRWFPLPLDGILASAARRRRLGRSYGLVVDHHVDRIGLNAFTAGGPWIWTATCAEPDEAAVEDVHWVHKRFRAQKAEQIVPRLPADTDAGLTKGWRIPVVATACRTLTWRAVGDPDEIRDLLGDVIAIGKKWGIGYGAVIRWEVEDVGEPDLPGLMWRDDGTVSRPIVAHPRALAWLGLPGDVETIPHSHRPPYWRPKQVHGGDRFTRGYRQVVAPWVTRQ